MPDQNHVSNPGIDQLSEMALSLFQIGTWHWYPKNESFYVSEIARCIFGFQHLQRIDRKSFLQHIHEADRARVDGYFFDVSSGVYENEYRIVVNGVVKYILEKGEVEKDRDLQLISVKAAIQDITKDKLHQSDLVAEHIFNDDARMIKDEFFSIISHEIRTLLNVVLGLSELLLHKHLTDEQREIVTMLNQSGNHLMNFVNRVLDFNKSKKNKLVLEKVHFNIGELLNTNTRSFQYLAHQKGLKLSSIIDENVPTLLYGDVVKINQIINNLLSNAIKFTSVGSVEIRVSKKESNSGYHHIQFSFRDTGPGIPNFAHSKIFEPFNEINADNKTASTGLGLSIVKNFLEVMNGTIHLESEPGYGSTFTVLVPFETKTEEDIAIAPINGSSEFPVLRNKRILYVEDVDTNQFLVQHLLDIHDALCDVASSGREALQMLARIPYDVILMDIQLPDTDGIEITRQVRNSDSINRDVPIIAFTADVAKANIQKMREHEINDIILKPFTGSVMFEKISTAIIESKPFSLRTHSQKRPK